MRGKATPWKGCAAHDGITPAYAGKRAIPVHEFFPLEDHPRVCGEKKKPDQIINPWQGSPPRMRGKVNHLLGGGDADGITPAYAGKRRISSPVSEHGWDHPRVCGEKQMGIVKRADFPGSPPRMRGKAACCSIAEHHLGITPAYAGKSLTPMPAAHNTGDHPRVCGEKCLIVSQIVHSLGSPPRMRGKGNIGRPNITAIGITPAYAGKSRHRRGVALAHGDHPRVCGEKPQRHLRLLLPTGITPAYAGKRLKRSHSIGHFSCILCLFHSVLHRASVSDGSRAGPCAPPCLPAQNAVPV